MSEKTEKCPKCHASIVFLEKDGDIEYWDCPNCGKINLKKENWKKRFKKELLKNCECCKSYLDFKKCGLINDTETTTKQAIEKYELRKWEICNDFEESKKPKITPIILTHINEIENPDLAGKPVIVSAMISSSSLAHLIPKKISSVMKIKDQIQVLERTFSCDDPINLKFTGISDTYRQKILKNLLGVKRQQVTELEYRTNYQLRVRPPVNTLEKKENKIVDEQGYEYKAYDISVVTETSFTFQPSTIIELEGVILPNPKTQRTTLLVYKIETPDDVRNFDIQKLNELKQKFEEKNVREIVTWIQKNFETYSHIYGRKNLLMATLLTYYTPLYVEVNGDMQRGWGNSLEIGDTTCAKSKVNKKASKLLKAGMVITAETASTVGLTGTACQLSGKEWTIDWGQLPLQDRKLLAIDGAHKLSSSNWAALAEAEREGIVRIIKAAKGSAYARTRQIKIANAIDVEENKYSTKSLANFLHPCQAVTTILDKTSIARLDLMVTADQRDVTPEEINRKHETEYDKKLQLLSESLKWCWSNKATVEFTEKAVEYLLEQATELHKKFFCELIPIVSIDVKWKLARLSVALAYLTLSTSDFQTVVVTKEHVKAVVDFVDEEYSKSGLNSIAKETKLDVLGVNDVKGIIDRVITAVKGSLQSKLVIEILKFIVLQGHVTKNQIKTRFKLADNNQLRPLVATLENEQLIKRGRGYYPTPKLIQAYKVTETPDFITFITNNNPEIETPRKKENIGSYF